MSDYEVHRARDIDEAIELASKFRDEKQYDWFRGQVRTEWPPYSSLMRRLLKDPDALTTQKGRLFRLAEWLGRTPGLEAMVQDTDAFFAIAQHYGIPTHYIDFTTDPAVAGFFAADTKEPVPPGTESCIFCLDSADL